MNKKTLILLVFLLVALCAAAWFLMRTGGDEPEPSGLPSPSPTPGSPTPGISISVIEPEGDPLYVFIMIGDGMGRGQRLLAQSYLGETGGALMMESLPAAGEITTHSLNADITDSAAGGTAIATGYKTNNGMLSVAPEGEPLLTIMEAAEEKGLSTGIVTTTRLTNATPAAFAAHNLSRTDDSGIALDFLDSGVDFFAGGGAEFFLPASHTGGNDVAGAPLKSSRADGEDPLSRFEELGYKTFVGADGAADFKAYEPLEGDMVLATFANANIPYELERINEGLPCPALAEMTDKAIDALEYDRDGFVLMVEGGRIDHACHINDVKGAILETLAFDGAVKAAYDFYLEHPEDTLIITVADHETGGLEFSPDGLRLEHLGDIRASMADRVQTAYTGDREAFFAYIAQKLGLDDLNPSEWARIELALEEADKAGPEKGYGSVVALAVSNVISKRAGVSWSSTGHTGVPVPFTAAGYMAQELSAFDNAELGQFLFDVLDSR